MNFNRLFYKKLPYFLFLKLWFDVGLWKASAITG